MIVRDALLLAWIVCLAPGCVAFPVRVPEEMPFKDVVEDHFPPGSTTVADVTEKLGEPAMQGDDWWLYRDSRAGWQWGFCAGGPYSASCGATPRAEIDYFLAVDFDQSQLVERVQLLRENELCEQRRICFEGDILMQAAPAPDAADAKLFRVPPAGCHVYTYSTTDKDSAAGNLIIDGELVGGLVGTSGFYAHPVSAGQHAWIVVPVREKILPLLPATSQLECKDGELVFMRYRYGMWGVYVERVEAERGRAEVLERWLAVSTPEYDDMLQSNWLHGGSVYVTKHHETVTAYRLLGSDRVPRWGRTDRGEPCGMRAVLDDYGLFPLGGEDQLLFGESLTSPVQLRPACASGSACTFDSVIDGESCEVDSADMIEFTPGYDLLVLESLGETYQEIYRGDSRPLKKHADCDEGRCTIGLSRLKELGGAAN